MCLWGRSFVYSLCVWLCVSWQQQQQRARESASFVSFFSFTSSIFLIFYAWNALLISSGPPLPLSLSIPSTLNTYNISLIITQKIDNLLWMLCVCLPDGNLCARNSNFENKQKILIKKAKKKIKLKLQYFDWASKKKKRHALFLILLIDY